MSIGRGSDRRRGPEADPYDQLKRILLNISCDSPEVKAWTARMAAEWVLRNVFKDVRGEFPDEGAKRPLSIPEIINNINSVDKNLVDRVVDNHFKTITLQYGNAAAHVHQRTGYTTLEEISPTLNALTLMLSWYLQYRDDQITKTMDLFPPGYDVRLGFLNANPEDAREDRFRDLDGRIPRNIGWLQAPSDQWWEIRRDFEGELFGRAFTLNEEDGGPSVASLSGAPFAISPDGRLAATLEGCWAQLWVLNLITGKARRWIRSQVLDEPLDNSQVLAVRPKGIRDAYLALDTGSELVLATGFHRDSVFHRRLVPCGPSRPLRASFSRNSLLYLTEGGEQGCCSLHEFPLSPTQPIYAPKPSHFNLIDIDTAEVNGALVTALLVRQNGTAMIVIDEGKAGRSQLELNGWPRLLGLVRTPRLPLARPCLVLESDERIEFHFGGDTAALT